MLRLQSSFEESSDNFEVNLNNRLREIKEIDNNYSQKYEKEFHVSFFSCLILLES